MAESDVTITQVSVPAAVMVVLSIAFSFGLYLVQSAAGFGYWVLNLAAFGPCLAGLVVWLVGRRVGWPVVCTAGWRLDGRVLRRTIALFAAGWAVMAGAGQVYTALRAPLKHVVFAARPHPWLSSITDPANHVILMALGMAVSCAVSEFGWRAVLHPTLRQRLGLVETAVVIGVGNALVQMPWLAGVVRRVQLFGQPLDGVEYLVFLLIAMVGVSLIVTIGVDPLARGKWLAATCCAWPIHFGLLIVLDEELGRWQAVGALAIGAWAWASLVYWVHRRGLPGDLADPKRGRELTAPVGT